MKTYTVKITGQQDHINSLNNVFEHQTESQVNAIIEKYLDDDYSMPKFDGNSYELNNEYYIEIVEEK
ncbi:hypothetical protein [Chryseobacterium sp. M5A1_1a]